MCFSSLFMVYVVKKKHAKTLGNKSIGKNLMMNDILVDNWRTCWDGQKFVFVSSYVTVTENNANKILYSEQKRNKVVVCFSIDNYRLLVFMISSQLSSVTITLLLYPLLSAYLFRDRAFCTEIDASDKGSITVV